MYFFISSDEASPYRQKMVIDHDGGADDAYAIAMAFQYEKFFYGYVVCVVLFTKLMFKTFWSN